MLDKMSGALVPILAFEKKAGDIVEPLGCRALDPQRGVVVAAKIGGKMLDVASQVIVPIHGVRRDPLSGIVVPFSNLRFAQPKVAQSPSPVGREAHRTLGVTSPEPPIAPTAELRATKLDVPAPIEVDDSKTNDVDVIVNGEGVKPLKTPLQQEIQGLLRNFFGPEDVSMFIS